jgi:cell division septation protein DedD
MGQALSNEDRQRGIEIAARLASRPLPATDRHIVTGGLQSPSPTPPSGTSATPHAGKPVPIGASATGAWQVQLGAYGSQQDARAAWGRMSGKAVTLRRLRPTYEKAGSLFRLRAGPLPDRAAAARACAAAKSAGAPCFIVLPVYIRRV